MKISDFIQLPLSKKIQHLYREGTFVMAIRYYGYKINLYLFDNNYIEVFYNHKLDLIEKVQPLNSQHSRMKFYYDQVKLPKMY